MMQHADHRVGGGDDGKRFGTLAVEKGFITLEQLIVAMKIQVEEDFKKEEHRFVGTILHSLEYISREQIIDVLQDLITSGKDVPPER